MALLDALSTRITAILDGSHAATSAVITPSLFTAGRVFLPAQNPEFPSGTASAAAERRWDLAWKRLAYDNTPPHAENAAQGPWVRLAYFDLRVQYALVRPNALAPRDRQLVLGALELATRKALDDLALIEFAFYRPGAWTGVALDFERDADATAAPADELRVVGTLSGFLRFSQSASTSPGAWT